MDNENIKILDYFLNAGNEAIQYAWDHYEELLNRQCAFTLYGPYDTGIGAGIPGKPVSKNSRKLTKETRRKHYLIYELDEKFNLLRTKTIRNYNEVEFVYHCFELDGYFYAIPFWKEEKKLSYKQSIALRFVDGKPTYLGFIRRGCLIAGFYQHVSEEKMLVKGYTYVNSPDVFHANTGIENVYLEEGCWKEDFVYKDFSSFFEEKDQRI